MFRTFPRKFVPPMSRCATVFYAWRSFSTTAVTASPTTSSSSSTLTLAKSKPSQHASLVDVGTKVSAFVSNGPGDPVAVGAVTAIIGDELVAVRFEQILSSSVVELGHRVVVQLERGTFYGLVAKVFGNGSYSVLLDDDTFEKDVSRAQIIHSEGRPRFIESRSFQLLLEWVQDAGVARKGDIESIGCILYHRGWRAEKLYLLEAADVHCLHHLNKSCRMGLLEKAEWERDQHRYKRELKRDKAKESEDWWYFSYKYSGVMSALVAVCGVASVFMWNFTNYRKQGRSYQVDTAVALLGMKYRSRHALTAAESYNKVERTAELERLTTLISKVDVAHPRVPVVTGRKGSGKTVLLRDALAQCDVPALFVDVRQSDDPLRSLVKALGVTNIEACGDLLDFVSEACTRAMKERLNGKVPFVVFKLRDADVSKVYSEALALACDRRVAHIFVEVDAEDLVARATRLPRVETVFVPDFTLEEARKYASHSIDPEALENFLEVVGTNAEDLDEYMAAVHLHNADEQRYPFLLLGDAMQRIIQLTNLRPVEMRQPKTNSARFEVIREIATLPFEIGKANPSVSPPDDSVLTELFLYNPESGSWVFREKLVYVAANSLL